MSDDLLMKKCSDYTGATAPVEVTQQNELLVQLPEWTVVEGKRLQREYRFKNYKRTLAFVNQVAEIAEDEKHHPDISFTWGKACVDIWTHSVGGLTTADFILAAKIGALNPATKS